MRVLITGGANGLGYQLSQHYLNEGAEVVVLDVDEKVSDGKLQYIYFDLASFDQSELDHIKDGFDIVICNAGISVSGNFTEIELSQEKNVLDINFFGHFQLIKYLLRRNLIRDNARIAFIASASCYLSFPIAIAYSASKAALDGFAYSLESYLVDKNISITRVYPGPMNTAHSKYYPGAQTEGGRLPEQSVPSIVKGIQKRKRKIFPDLISKFYRITSRLIPKQLNRKTFHFYKERMGK